MAVLLMVMFRHRGVLLPQQIAPVVTFGAPAVFCDGALGGCSVLPEGAEACSLVRCLAAPSGWRVLCCARRASLPGMPRVHSKRRGSYS